MFGRKKSILDEIQRGALDERTPLAHTLRKCLLLGGMAHSTVLRDWASRELNGYSAGDHHELPDWRKVYAPLQIDGAVFGGIVRQQTISSYSLPDFARDTITEEVTLTQGVGALEALLRNADGTVVKLGPPGSADLVMFMNHDSDEPHQHIERLYWAVSVTAIEGVLDRIRTALVQLVAEIRSNMPDDSVVPTPEVANQAYNVAVKGKFARVTINNASSGAVITNNGPAEPEPPQTGRLSWKKIGAGLVGLAGIIGAVAGLGQWLGW
jgi:hypothetical protein